MASTPGRGGTVKRACVRHFISPDVDLEDFRPEDPDDFWFLVQALVGPCGEEGEESLQVIVCTPRYLARRAVTEPVIFGRPLVIVNSANLPEILDAIRAAIEKVEAPTWNQVADRLSRLGIYEFEDYH